MIREKVRCILDDIQKNRAKAVLKYCLEFDGEEFIEIDKEMIRKAYKNVDKRLIEALKKAAKNIEDFAKKQFEMFNNFEIEDKGVVLGQKVIPLQKVGCYVPGGRYALPSSALMSVIPAKIAGVKEIIVCSPKIKPEVIVAADIAGADRIFSIGGVQAIGAMAYGAGSIPRVDKIVGPGNKYVAEAKRQVYGEVGIDFIAGPSEILIIADESCDASFVAADLLAQAEHDPDARCGLICTSKEIAENVEKEIQRQIVTLKTKEVALQAMKNFEIIIADLDKAIEIANENAPEHLELQIRNPENIIDKLFNYGSLFIGKYSAEVFGDYCSGTNHILPTSGASRYTGGLSVKDFVKILTYQEITQQGVKEMNEIASVLAGTEGLEGHKKAGEIRKGC